MNVKSLYFNIKHDKGIITIKLSLDYKAIKEPNNYLPTPPHELDTTQGQKRTKFKNNNMTNSPYTKT